MTQKLLVCLLLYNRLLCGYIPNSFSELAGPTSKGQPNAKRARMETMDEEEMANDSEFSELSEGYVGVDPSIVEVPTFSPTWFNDDSIPVTIPGQPARLSRSPSVASFGSGSSNASSGGRATPTHRRKPSREATNREQQEAWNTAQGV